MISGSIARRYAKALFSLAEEKGRVDPWLEGLDSLARVVAASPELRAALASPVHRREDRRALAGELARATRLEEDPTNLLLLLADRRRLDQLDSVVGHFRALADQKLGRVRARVVSAVPLDDAAARALAGKLSAATRAEVILERAVDPSIVGGVVTQVGSLTYDGSVRTQLEQLRRTLAA